MNEMSEIDVLKEKLESYIHFDRDALINPLEFAENIEKLVEELTNKKCEYRFDEYPTVYTQKVFDDGSYISFGNNVDELECDDGTRIYIEMKRIDIQLIQYKTDLMLILEHKVHVEY